MPMDGNGVPDKAGRIRQHAQGLVQEVRTWMELQMELAGIRIWERLEVRLSHLRVMYIVSFLACTGLTFLLVAVALWLETFLGHIYWGFALVGLATGLVAWIIYLVRLSSGYSKESPANRNNSEQTTN